MPVPQRIIGRVYGSIVQREGTPQVKDIAAVSRLEVSADGRGVVSHAGMGLLRELADLTGLSAQVTAVLADTYRGPWTHAPGAVFADLAAAVADGADCIPARINSANTSPTSADFRASSWGFGPEDGRSGTVRGVSLMVSGSAVTVDGECRRRMGSNCSTSVACPRHDIGTAVNKIPNPWTLANPA